MACMKCGKETQEGQLFCARCLESMEAYPVKPDVHIQLPVRSKEAAPKKQSRKGHAPQKDAQLAALQWKVRWMALVILVLLLALFISNVKELRNAVKPDSGDIGRNYTYSQPTP